MFNYFFSITNPNNDVEKVGRLWFYTESVYLFNYFQTQMWGVTILTPPAVWPIYSPNGTRSSWIWPSQVTAISSQRQHQSPPWRGLITSRSEWLNVPPHLPFWMEVEKLPSVAQRGCEKWLSNWGVNKDKIICENISNWI